MTSCLISTTHPMSMKLTPCRHFFPTNAMSAWSLALVFLLPPVSPTTADHKALTNLVTNPWYQHYKTLHTINLIQPNTNSIQTLTLTLTFPIQSGAPRLRSIRGSEETILGSQHAWMADLLAGKTQRRSHLSCKAGTAGFRRHCHHPGEYLSYNTYYLNTPLLHTSLFDTPH